MLSNNIKKIMKEKNVSKTMLSNKSRLDPTAISRIINRKDLSKVYLKTLYAIAKALNVRVRDLFIETKESDNNVDQ